MALLTSPPAPLNRLLQAHPDPRRAGLRFDADTHQYYIHDQPAASVSSLYRQFFPEFDAPYWAKRKAQERGCAPEDILREWDDKRTASAEAGTALHHLIETFYHDGTATDDRRDFAHFLAFHRDHPDLVPYRTEWQIYHEELLLAGTVDFVTRNPDGSLSIYDWKRSQKIVNRHGQPIGNTYQTAEGPLKDLPDCSLSHYSLQLNLYKWLLEEKYDVQVRDLNLVVLHPDFERYHVVPVAEYPRHVAQMVATRR